MSHVTSYVSHVTCQVLHVMCHVSHVMCDISYLYIYIFFFGQSGEAFWWRVCYRQGLPRATFQHNYLKYILECTRRYGPLRGPTSSSCWGLRSLAEAYYAVFLKITFFQKKFKFKKKKTYPKKKKKKNDYPLSFPILGGRHSTRALQPSPFQISGVGSLSVTDKQRTEDEEWRTEILVFFFCMHCLFDFLKPFS